MIPSNTKNKYAKNSFTVNGEGLFENKIAPKIVNSTMNSKINAKT